MKRGINFIYGKHTVNGKFFCPLFMHWYTLDQQPPPPPGGFDFDLSSSDSMPGLPWSLVKRQNDDSLPGALTGRQICQCNEKITDCRGKRAVVLPTGCPRNMGLIAGICWTKV